MIHGEIKVTQLVSGRARIQTQIIWLQSPLNSYAICFLRQWSVLDLGSITLTPHHPLHTRTHTHTNTQLHSLQDKLSYVSFHILQRTLVQLSLYKKLKGRKGSEEGAGWGKGSRLGALGESHLTSGELWRSCAWNTPGPGWVLCLLNRDDVETLVPSYVRWRVVVIQGQPGWLLPAWCPAITAQGLDWEEEAPSSTPRGSHSCFANLPETDKRFQGFMSPKAITVPAEFLSTISV